MREFFQAVYDYRGTCIGIAIFFIIVLAMIIEVFRKDKRD